MNYDRVHGFKMSMVKELFLLWLIFLVDFMVFIKPNRYSVPSSSI